MEHVPSNTRVPLVGPRSRYLLLGLTPVWVYHKLATGAGMTGVAPETATTDATHTDPTVSAGIASYTALTKGGYFKKLADEGHAYIVEAIDNPANATVTIENAVLGTSRAMPATVPFRVGAKECLKGVTATTGAQLGFLVRLDIPVR